MIRFKWFFHHAYMEIRSHFKLIPINLITHVNSYCENEACSDDLLVFGSKGLLVAVLKATHTAYPFFINTELQDVTFVF